jgi:hypothetical protein
MVGVLVITTPFGALVLTTTVIDLQLVILQDPSAFT